MAKKYVFKFLIKANAEKFIEGANKKAFSKIDLVSKDGMWIVEMVENPKPKKQINYAADN